MKPETRLQLLRFHYRALATSFKPTAARTAKGLIAQSKAIDAISITLRKILDEVEKGEK